MAKLAKIYTNNPHNGLGNITLIMFLQGWISAEQYSSMLGTNILKFLSVKHVYIPFLPSRKTPATVI